MEMEKVGVYIERRQKRQNLIKKIAIILAISGLCVSVVLLNSMVK